MGPDLILLYSGGLDSRLLLEVAVLAQQRPFCIIFDYGQRHIQEVTKAKKVCTDKSVPYKVIRLSLPDVKSALTSGESHLYQGVSEWYVPARNLIFISVAASCAESMGIDRIWFGANYEDRVNLFPDCYQEWVYKTNELLQINGSRPIKVEAPLLGWTKQTITSVAEAMKINMEEVFSGYGQ